MFNKKLEPRFLKLRKKRYLPGIRGGKPAFIGETSIGSFMGGNALGSPVGCFGGLFSSKLESESLLLSSSIVPPSPLLVCSVLVPSPFVFG